MFIRGKVTESPDRARAPTSGIWPMKMLSTILYSEEAVIAMMAGMAYCSSSAPIFFVPSSVGDSLCLILRLFDYPDVKNERSVRRD